MGTLKVLFVPVYWGKGIGGVSDAGMQLTKHLDVDVLHNIDNQHVNMNVGLHQIRWLLSAIPAITHVALRYDLIHFWGAFPSIYLPKLGRPYIVSCHGTDVPGKSESSDRVLKWAYGYKKRFIKAKRVAAINSNLAGLIKDFTGRTDVAVIPNGVEVNRVRDKIPLRHPIRFVTAGRLVESRRIHLAINAVRSLDGATLDVYGDGPLLGVLQNKLDNDNLRGKVRLKGWSNDLQDVFADYDIYINTAVCSGPTLCLLQAMAAGLECVTTSYPNAQSYSNYVLNPQNNMSKEIQRFVEMVKRYGYATPRTTKIPSWEDVADKYRKLYEESA